MQSCINLTKGVICSVWQNCTWATAVEGFKGSVTGVLGAIILNYLTWMIWLIEPASFGLIITDVAAGLVFFIIMRYLCNKYAYRYANPMLYLVEHLYLYGVAISVIYTLMWYTGFIISDIALCTHRPPMRAWGYSAQTIMWIC